jgi:predicted Zn-dependent peptidase
VVRQLAQKATSARQPRGAWPDIRRALTLEKPMPRRFPLAAALALLVPLAVPAAAQHVEVEELVLDNGMTFLLVPRHEDPNTVALGWVAKVGSVNERPGITGISHFFEHMMFKGTTTIGTRDADRDAELMARQREVKSALNELVWSGQYDRYRRGEIDDPWDPAHDTEEISRLRGELRDLMEAHREIIVTNEFDEVYTNAGATGMNAFTSEDLTFYFINLPSNKLELWAWMESDRLNDSVFREFYAERDVVHEERRMGLESNPTGRLDEQFDAMFWQSSPYGWSVIGWPSDLNSYTREQFDDYFNVHYRPNNLVGIVVGDFDPAEARPVIERYFGRLERGERTPPPVVTLEIESLAEKRLVGECDCQPQVQVRYHTVGFGHPDGFALEMLGHILNGRTGRLYKSMIEGAEIASSAAAAQESRRYGGFFSFGAEVKGEATPEDLEQAWLAEVERLRTEPVDARELQKVKNRIAADSYRRLQSNTALLFQLGMYEALGGWEHINESPGRLMAVTPEDIQRVVATYFTGPNRSVAIYRRRQGPTDELPYPPHMQDQVEAMLGEFLSKDDPDELRTILAFFEAQKDAFPDDVRPAIEYVKQRVLEHVAELERKAAEEPGN